MNELLHCSKCGGSPNADDPLFGPCICRAAPIAPHSGVGLCPIPPGQEIESAEAPGADVARLAQVLRGQRAYEVGDYDKCADALEYYAGTIAEHNKRCERECESSRECRVHGCFPASVPYSRCPRLYMIDTKETK